MRRASFIQVFIYVLLASVCFAADGNYTNLRVGNVRVDAGKYASFNALVAAAGSTPTTVILDRNLSLTASTTVPSTLSLEIKKGGTISQGGAFTLTINGPFSAGPHQVFSGFSTGQVTFGSGSVGGVSPEWWGWSALSTPDTNSAAFAAAMAGLAENGIMYIPSGTYSHSGLTIDGSFSYKTLRGLGMPVLSYTGTGVGVSIAGTQSGYLNGALIEGIFFQNPGVKTPGQHGVEFRYAADNTVRSIYIKDAGDNGIHFAGACDRNNFHSIGIENSHGYARWFEGLDGGSGSRSNENRFFGTLMWNNENGTYMTHACYNNQFYGDSYEQNSYDGYAINLNNGRGNQWYGMYIEDNRRNNDVLILIDSGSYNNTFDAGMIGIGGSAVTPTVFQDKTLNTEIRNFRRFSSVVGAKWLDVTASVRGGVYWNNDEYSSTYPFAASTFNSNAEYIHNERGVFKKRLDVFDESARRQALFRNNSGPTIAFEDGDASAGRKRVEIGQADGIFYVYGVSDDASTRVAKMQIDGTTGSIRGLVSSNGPVGTFTLASAATTTVSNTSVTASSRIFLQSVNAAAATLEGGSKKLYINTLTPGASFTVTTGSGLAAEGTEQFNYWLVN